MPDTFQGMAVVLFDGVCNLCNAFVLFVIDRDPRGRFAFAPLQSEYATALLRDHGYRDEAVTSVVLIEDGRAYDRSSAALRIVRHLNGLWPALSLLRLVPRRLRDWLYDMAARRRYRWFGRSETCRVPTLELRSRFLA
jgi:predicted DCC family thiol-disulfide oxidoreductase YuxK